MPNWIFQVPVCNAPRDTQASVSEWLWYVRKPKNVTILRQVLKHLSKKWFRSRFMEVCFRWTEIYYTLGKCRSHWAIPAYHVPVLRFDGVTSQRQRKLLDSNSPCYSCVSPVLWLPSSLCSSTQVLPDQPPMRSTWPGNEVIKGFKCWDFLSLGFYLVLLSGFDFVHFVVFWLFLYSYVDKLCGFGCFKGVFLCLIWVCPAIAHHILRFPHG